MKGVRGRSVGSCGPWAQLLGLGYLFHLLIHRINCELLWCGRVNKPRGRGSSSGAVQGGPWQRRVGPNALATATSTHNCCLSVAPLGPGSRGWLKLHAYQRLSCKTSRNKKTWLRTLRRLALALADAGQRHRSFSCASLYTNSMLAAAPKNNPALLTTAICAPARCAYILFDSRT